MENHNKVLMLMVCTFFFCTMPTYSIQHTLTPNQFIQYNDTLVSTAGTFEAGFFNFGDPQRQYFGIWYNNISPKTIVWVANRNTPVQNSTAMMKLNDQGSLVILDGSKGIIWSSNSSNIVVKSVVVLLLDSGNLVVKEANRSSENEDFLWESFDYPGNTFLVGMKLKTNLITGPYKYLTSWRNPEDPAEGEFSYRIDARGFPQLVIAKKTILLYRQGSWHEDADLFTGISWQRLFSALSFSVFLTDNELSYQYQSLNSSIITRVVLDPNGISQRFLWSDRVQIWESIKFNPADQCDLYAMCGINSNCNINDFPTCECLEGFMPKFQTKWNSSNWSDGCVRKTPLNCLHGDVFFNYTGMKLPDTSSSWFDNSLSLEECKTMCLKNCSCTACAIANLDITYGGSGCLLWFDNIVDMRKHPNKGQHIYIRLASSEFGGTFEAGFFNFGDPQRQYFGIWYKRISQRTIVWVANRNTPVQHSTAMLKLNDQGTIVILDGIKGIIWNSNSSRIGVKPVVQLLDSGNLVLKDGNNTRDFLWESFDYPGNTFLAGMKLKCNLVTGPYKYLTSWRNPEDPAEGEFSFKIYTHGYLQQFTTNGARILYRGGSWNGIRFTGVVWQRNNRIVNFSVVFTDKEVSYQYDTLINSNIAKVVLDPNGNAQRFLWLDTKQIWVVTATSPSDQCDEYALCGINSNCNINDFPICECLEGFMPKFQTKWKSSNWSDGCVRKTQLNCLHGDGFLPYTNMKLPDTSESWFDRSMTLEECKTTCLKNCSCTAYANLDISNGGSGCLLWFDNIVDMRKHPGIGQDIYIRLASSELDHKKNKRNLKLYGTLAGVIAFIIGLTVLVLVAYRKKLHKPGYIKKLFYWKYNKEKEDGDLVTIFDFWAITNATNNFSNRNKLGEGGFGPVYKGIMEDGQEIAVKRLSETSGQGIEEFKNEVKLMATLQHRNLVKLLGCSIQQDEKLLIYEFMPNRSLDYFIYDTARSKSLDWTKRLEIIDGIARGLLYLHQDSRLRIIHRDLKTSNILLDIDMIPKIADFGLARSFMGDQAEANTNRVIGTYGYMPPEYAVHGSFSIKSDVFSFGVVALEIISGRKNRGFCDPLHHLNLLGHAWRLWSEDRAKELIADILDDEAMCSKIIRFIHVGLLCVQQKPENRPNMSSVVYMLKGETLIPKPSEPGFYAGSDNTNDIESSSKGCSINDVSISLEGR